MLPSVVQRSWCAIEKLVWPDITNISNDDEVEQNPMKVIFSILFVWIRLFKYTFLFLQIAKDGLPVVPES